MDRGAGHVVWVLAFAVLALGCGASSTDDDQATEPTATTASPSLEPTESTGPTGLAPVAIADLATRLDVDPTSIDVVSDESVTWNNGSLGCARPGMTYTQSLVEGGRITLRVDEVDYEYHVGGSNEPFWCEEPTQ